MFFDILKRITEMLMVQEMKKQLLIKWILFHYTVMHHLKWYYDQKHNSFFPLDFKTMLTKH